MHGWTKYAWRIAPRLWPDKVCILMSIHLFRQYFLPLIVPTRFPSLLLPSLLPSPISWAQRRDSGRTFAATGHSAATTLAPRPLRSSKAGSRSDSGRTSPSAMTLAPRPLRPPDNKSAVRTSGAPRRLLKHTYIYIYIYIYILCLVETEGG